MTADEEEIIAERKAKDADTERMYIGICRALSCARSALPRLVLFQVMDDRDEYGINPHIIAASGKKRTSLRPFDLSSIVVIPVGSFRINKSECYVTSR